MVLVVLKGVQEVLSLLPKYFWHLTTFYYPQCYHSGLRYHSKNLPSLLVSLLSMAPLTVLPFGSIDHNISVLKTNNGFQRRPYLISFFLPLFSYSFFFFTLLPTLCLFCSPPKLWPFPSYGYLLCFLTLQPVIIDVAALSVFLGNFSWLWAAPSCPMTVISNMIK